MGSGIRRPAFDPTDSKKAMEWLDAAAMAEWGSRIPVKPEPMPASWGIFEILRPYLTPYIGGK